MTQKDEKLRAIFNSIDDIICLTDLEGKLIECNEAAVRLWGADTKEELCTFDAFQFVAEKDKARAMENMDKLFQNGHIMSTEYTFLTKDGGEYPVEANVSLARDESGNPAGLVVVLKDITQRKKLEDDLHESLFQTVAGFGKLMDIRDPYTAGHQLRVSEISAGIGKEMCLPDDKIVGLRMAAVIHDIGKITVPSDILSKPGPLNGYEFGIIKQHPLVAFDVLKNMRFSWPLADAVLQHHERLDGSGYPYGLKDDDIMLEAKIIAVADVMEAMSSHRPYRPALGMEVAFNEISQKSGKLYDPAVVDACLRLYKY